MNRYQRKECRLVGDGHYESMHPIAWEIGSIFGDLAGRLSQFIYSYFIVAWRGNERGWRGKWFFQNRCLLTDKIILFEFSAILSNKENMAMDVAHSFSKFYFQDGIKIVPKSDLNKSLDYVSAKYIYPAVDEYISDLNRFEKIVNKTPKLKLDN